MKKWAESLLLIVAGIIIVALISELIVRIAKPRRMVITGAVLHDNDASAGWIGHSNINGRFYLPGGFDLWVANNSRGLRDSEKRYIKLDGIRRILVLGDGFMWGFGVESDEMFSTILQTIVPDSETVNFGVSGYSTVQELVRLEAEGIKYQSDFTVLAFFWNDLEGNLNEDFGIRPVAVIEENDILRIAYPSTEIQHSRKISQWFRHHTHLFGFVEYRVRLLQYKVKARRRAKATTTSHNGSVAVLPDTDDQMSKKSFSAANIYAPPSPEIDLAWKAVRLLLQRIKDVTAKSGGQLIVMYVTPKESVYADLFDRVIREAGLEPASDDIDRDRPSNRLGGICEDLNIPCVNLDTAFRNHPEPLSLFLSRDPHWSAAGHRLAAETVAAYMETLTDSTGLETQTSGKSER